jgi:SAM-dependent methyltransferase
VPVLKGQNRGSAPPSENRLIGAPVPNRFLVSRTGKMGVLWAFSRSKMESGMNTSAGKDRTKLMSVLRSGMNACGVDPDESILVIGASQDDLDLLRQAGFTNITASNISAQSIGESIPQLSLNADSIDLPDESVDLVFAHAVLHHCRSPHRALCEMLRVARRHSSLSRTIRSACGS